MDSHIPTAFVFFIQNWRKHLLTSILQMQILLPIHLEFLIPEKPFAKVF